MIQVAYFGCWNEPGHYLHDHNGRNLRSFGPFIPESLDNTFNRDKRERFTTITYFKDYTILAFTDNTIDKRPGSNSCFIIEGSNLSKKQCWEAAELVFPQIVNRLKGYIRGAKIEDRDLG